MSERDIEIGLRIKKARQFRRITQVQLAKRLGTSQTAIALWENGSRRIPYEIIDVIAEILNISASYLMFGDADFNDDIENKKVPELTAQDEKDITKDLDRIMNEIQKGDDGPLYYNGAEIDKASLSLLQNAIEYALRETKKENKVKYSSNKNKE